MKQYTLNGYTIAFPAIPEGATVYRVHQLKTAWLLTDVNPIPLPPGDWQLYRLSEVSEELAGEMVEEDEFAYWKTYTEENMFWESTAHASFVSWVRAQGVTDNDPYLLIKKND